MKDRIVKFLANESLTATRFADEIGVQRSSVSHILSGRNNPSFEFIQKILSRYKNLNADWLILGTGSMYKKTEQLNMFSAAPPTPRIQQQDLFSVPPDKKLSPAEGDKKTEPVHLTENFPSRKVDKILVFYTDKTFEEFMPPKNP